MNGGWILDLPTLSYCRLKGDMIEVYKIVNGDYDAAVSDIFHDVFSPKGTKFAPSTCLH